MQIFIHLYSLPSPHSDLFHLSFGRIFIFLLQQLMNHDIFRHPVISPLYFNYKQQSFLIICIKNETYIFPSSQIYCTYHLILKSKHFFSCSFLCAQSGLSYFIFWLPTVNKFSSTSNFCLKHRDCFLEEKLQMPKTVD